VSRTRVARAARAAGLVLAVGLVACSSRGARDGAGAVAVRGAWVRTSPPGAGVGALYLTLKSAHDDRLLAVSVPPTVAARAELHEVTRDSLGRIGMREVASVGLPAGRAVAFRPGDRHIMLMELARPLAAGDTIPVALSFERAAPETVRAPVRDD
jgi:copper(I)-binding protein